MHPNIYLSSKCTCLGYWVSSILLASYSGSHWQCPIPNQRDPARRLTNMHDFCPPLYGCHTMNGIHNRIEFWTFFFLSLDSQWVWHHVPCLDILGRGSCCLANLPHWTGKMGSNDRWDWKVSFVGSILVNVKWNSYPDFSLSPRHFAACSLFRKEKFQGKPLGPGYEIVDICLSMNSQVSTWAPHLNSSVF